MDQLPALGTNIWECLQPTLAAYAPLLLSNASSIKSTPKETHRYGPLPRQQLDIYFPPSFPASSSASAGGRRKVLVFLYGGGLQSGDRTRPFYADGLTYDNLAHYFASRHGFVVVIPDYRLIEHGAAFPSGGEDLAAVLGWMQAELVGRDGFATTTTTTGGGGGIDLSVMGHSAGGIHACTYLFAPRFAESRAAVVAEDAKVRLRAVVFLAVPYHFRASAGGARKAVLEGYFGGAEGVEANCPLSLLVSAVKSPGGMNLPGVEFMKIDGPLDPDDEILEPGRDFMTAWPEHIVELRSEIAEGHNHISPTLALGTGIEKEEAWGELVAKFVNEACGE